MISSSMKEVNFEKILQKLVPSEMVPEILGAEDVSAAFFKQWVLREAYTKWTERAFTRISKNTHGKGTSCTFGYGTRLQRGAVVGSSSGYPLGKSGMSLP